MNTLLARIAVLLKAAPTYLTIAGVVVAVVVDEVGIRCIRSDGEVHEVGWAGLVSVAVETNDGGPFLAALGDVALDAVALAFGHDGSALGGRVQRIPDLVAGDGFGQRITHLGVATV